MQNNHQSPKLQILEMCKQTGTIQNKVAGLHSTKLENSGDTGNSCHLWKSGKRSDRDGSSNLLRREWLNKLKLIWSRIFAINKENNYELQEILRKYRGIPICTWYSEREKSRTTSGLQCRAKIFQSMSCSICSKVRH